MLTCPTPHRLPVAAPVRVASRLAAAVDGPRRLVHSGSTAIYVDLDGWCLGLVAADASRVPCALWSTLADLAPLAGRAAFVRSGALVVGEHEVRVTRLVDVSVPTPVRRCTLPPHDVPLVSGLDLPLEGGLTPADVDRLLGRGPGLTPLGDDVLAGWLTARAALGHPDDGLAAAVRSRLGATTLLSATLLDCAARGEALPQLAAWLREPSDAAAEALLAVGATSGAGLMAGARLALAGFEHPTTRPRSAA